MIEIRVRHMTGDSSHLGTFPSCAALAAWVLDDSRHPHGMYDVRDKERRAYLAELIGQEERGLCPTGCFVWGPE